MDRSRHLRAASYISGLAVVLLLGPQSRLASAQSRVYLSDLSWASASNGWGPTERDHSNGDIGLNDGKIITLNGVTYAKGLGVHAPSDVRFELAKNCTQFSAVVGLDDEVGNSGNVIFQVWTNGVKQFDSGVMTGATASKTVAVNLTNVTELALVVTTGSDNTNAYDHADWADAQATCNSTTSAPITGQSLSDLTWTSAASGWGPVERDRSNGEINANDGKTLTLNGVTYAKGLGVHAPSDVRYALNSACTQFSAVVGVDDEVGNSGNVVFQVWTNGVKQFDSGVMTGASASQTVTLSVTGVNELALIVTTGSDNSNAYDHADWANAQVTCSAAAAPAAPVAPVAPVVPPPTSTAQVSPGQSIQAASAAAPTGATILIKAGTHRLQSVTPKNDQVFVGETGAILSGAVVLTSFSRSGSYWYASGQTQEGARSGSIGDQVCRDTAPRCGFPEDLYFNSVPLFHVDSLGAVGPGKWYFDYAADRIYFADDPTGKTVETSVTPVAFGGYATNVRLSNLVVEKYASPTGTAAVQLGTGWIIEDSTTRLNHFSGIGNGPSSIVRRTYVQTNGGLGIFGAGNNIQIANNEISYNGFAGYNPYWGSGGSKWVQTQNLSVTGNFSHHNMGPGLWTDINNIYTLYENNTVEDNERSGIFHELSYDATIRYNTARRNGTETKWYWWTAGAGIEILTSPNVEIYGNTIENNWNGITALYDDARGTGAYGPWLLKNLYVHDNNVTTSLLDDGIGRTGVVDAHGTDGFAAAANNRFRNNHYVIGAKVHPFIWLNQERTDVEWRGFGQDTTGTFQK